MPQGGNIFEQDGRGGSMNKHDIYAYIRTLNPDVCND